MPAGRKFAKSDGNPAPTVLARSSRPVGGGLSVPVGAGLENNGEHGINGQTVIANKRRATAAARR